jgi:L-lactate dehydrogenase complex protein LldG
MTNPIIDNIRLSLGRTDQTKAGQRPAVLESRQPGSIPSEIDLFMSEVRKLSGSAQNITHQSIASSMKELVSGNKIQRATLWHTPLLEQLGIESTLRDMGVQIIPPDANKKEMSLCDLGITEADYLLPETGTIVLRSSAKRPRAVSLLPGIHLAIVRSDMLRADLHQVFTEASDSHYLVFITGPSRTADIELTVTLGVHGPKNLHVWMLEG